MNTHSAKADSLAIGIKNLAVFNQLGFYGIEGLLAVTSGPPKLRIINSNGAYTVIILCDTNLLCIFSVWASFLPLR